MTDMTYRRIDSEDADGNPITFEGRELGHASSKRASHQPRWMEMTIFQTHGGHYVLEIVGMSNVPGDVTKQRAHVFENPEDVIEKMHSTHTCNVDCPSPCPQVGRRYLTYTARECLFQAMEVDRGLNRAWDKRARVVA
jgi:hypothetical protein